MIETAAAITLVVAVTLSLNASSLPIHRNQGTEKIESRWARKSSTSHPRIQDRPIYEAVSLIRDNDKSDKPASLGSLQSHLRQCSNDRVCLRLTAEYGSLFAANAQKVLLPPHLIFRNESEVGRFQQRAGISSEVIGGIRVELQPEALKAFLAARTEARQHGFNITPRGSNSSRRSYADTVSLWQERVNDALAYWTSHDRLTKSEAQRLRSLSVNKQVPIVLALEARHLFFGTGHRKSILESVAAPGSSQHIAMLALDIAQYDDPRVREILARHGWFRTVRNDEPHFTYLGVEQSVLPLRGLRRETSGGMVVWIPRIRPLAKARDSQFREPDPWAVKSKNAISGQPTDEDLDRSEDDSRDGPNRTVNGASDPGVEITPTMRPLLQKLTDSYFRASGGVLHITSAYRTPEAQAKAMYRNLVSYGRDYVLETYGERQVAVEIASAYLNNRMNRSRAITARTKVILGQVRQGLYVSRHMLGRAFDIRLSSAKPSLLRKVVRRLGGHLDIEADHYHVQF
jgi:hypothetical protein